MSATRENTIEKTDFGPGKTALYYNNVGLFSDPFLEERLPNLDEYYKSPSTRFLNDYWNIDESDAVKYNAAFQGVLNLWHELDQDIPTYCSNERQLQNRWIDKIFELLGWTIELEESSSKHGITNFPDYALFASNEDWKKSKTLSGNHKFKKATAVADAKGWGINLDGKGYSNKNPSYQIINYLKQTDKNWGILTDGKYWRIYSLRSDSKHTTFYEIDLEKILASIDKGDGYERFKYFYNFFRVEAFVSDSRLNDRSFLDFVFDDGQFYAQRVENNLQERAYKVADTICKGFLESYTDPTEDDLKEIYEYSMYYLFKLMFVLNCESKGLLEVNKQDDYYEFSLRKKCLDIKEQSESGKSWSGQPRTYNYINDLFTLLKEGDSKIGVHGFGREPFEIGSEDFYYNHKISDEILNQALLELSCDHDEENDLQFIDYKILSPDHIGSLFEGLLEFSLKKKGKKYLLENDNGERKASGAFYTPDYLVDFVVERTLGPLVENKEPTEIMKLKVIDPAMGSGHFLLGVVKYIESEIVKIQNADKKRSTFIEFGKLRREIIKNCIFGSDINPLATELAKFSLWIHSSQKGEKLEPLADQMVCRNSLADKEVLDIYLRLGITPEWKYLNIKSDFRGGPSSFDAVVGNPPWGAELSEESIEILSERYKHSSYKLIDTFKFFIERATEFIQKDSRIGLVVPRSLLSHIGCRDTRSHLLSNGVQEIYDLGDGVFKGVCAPSVAFIVNNSGKPNKVSFYDAKTSRNKLELLSLKPNAIKYKDIKSNTNCEFLFSSIHALTKQDDVFPLGDLCEVFDSGLDYSRKKLGDAVFYKAESPKSKKDHKVLRGKNISRFVLNEGKTFLRHDWKKIETEQRLEDKKTRLKVNKVAYEDQEKILVRQTSDQIIAAYDNAQYYNQKSLLSIHKKRKNVSLFYILGVVNSSYITSLYRELVSEEGQAFSQVKKNKLQQIPIVLGRNSGLEKKIAGLAKKLTHINNTEEAKFKTLIEELESCVEELYSVEAKKNVA